MWTSRTEGDRPWTFFTMSSSAIVYARGSSFVAAKAQKSQVATHTFVWLMWVFHTK